MLRKENYILYNSKLSLFKSIMNKIWFIKKTLLKFYILSIDI